MNNSTRHIKTGLCYVLFLVSLTSTYGQIRTPVAELKEAITYSLQQDGNSDNAEKIQMLAGPPIYQINTGGWKTSGSWQKDTRAHPSPYLNPTYYRSANGIDWYEFFTEKSRISSRMEWNFPVENGNYIVTLYFVESENSTQSVGSRVFDVNIEGKKALDNFDIIKFTGKGFPASFNFSVEVSDNNLDLDFMAEYFTDALISAIVITPGVIPSHDPVLSQMTRSLETTVHEGAEFRIPIRATDFDSPSSAIRIFGGDTGVPVDFVTVVDHGNGKGEMIIKPDYDNAGSYLLYIAAEDEDGLETDCDACWALVDLTVLDTPEGNAIYRVNAADWISADDTPISWTEDSYANPSPYVLNGYKSQSHFIRSNPTTAPDEIFRRSRVAWHTDMRWRFPVASGVYTVDLYFAESHFNTSGKRVFDVLVEGETEISNLDIYNEIGEYMPLQKTIITEVTDGYLDILLKEKEANPIIAGISITYNGEVMAAEMARTEAPDVLEANSDLAMKTVVYPNPVNDHMTFVLPRAVSGQVGVRLINRNNQVSYSAINHSDTERSEVMFAVDPKLPAGIYQAEIVAANYREYIQILKR
ncbi:hypothetical protein C900_00399 [Fulvivirga imtechensis AK7]|uniref:Malectin domain-containing protein n=1 Tax=Fulvivirga imtechensis AK7 TaxID=1237149 RepID=L8JHT9_9BACT|nr:malectin domain-containing carbohydrate-binding protein [Fulvivirga imtechensis]ELR68431.1 hypothetical protein C900_00399 [Fulvivirga imtechensis AK7]